MDIFTALGVIVGLAAASLSPTLIQPPFEAGSYSLHNCKVYSNSHNGYIRCLKDTNYEVCGLTSDMYGALDPSIPRLNPQNLHCEILPATLSISQVGAAYPDAQYCGFDKTPGTVTYESGSTMKALQKKQDEYNAYYNKVIISNIHDIIPLLATKTCNVIWR